MRNAQIRKMSAQNYCLHMFNAQDIMNALSTFVNNFQYAHGLLLNIYFRLCALSQLFAAAEQKR